MFSDTTGYPDSSIYLFHRIDTYGKENIVLGKEYREVLMQKGVG